MTTDPGIRVKRRRCPTGKLKYFNKAWADIAAAESTERFGSKYKSYPCVCGWWHTFDREKKRRKENLREPVRVRKRRAKRGEPSPLQVLREQQHRATRQAKRARRRAREAYPLHVWADDGGPYWPPRED